LIKYSDLNGTFALTEFKLNLFNSIMNITTRCHWPATYSMLCPFSTGWVGYSLHFTLRQRGLHSKSRAYIRLQFA